MKNWIEQKHKDRRKFFKKHRESDHVILIGENKVLISSPHGVSQNRNGRPKVAEIGSAMLALELQKETKSNLIIKTKNNFDDANFDEQSAYKFDMFKFIEENDITHVLDFHGMKKSRPLDVNLGAHFGKNTSVDEKLLFKLERMLKKAGFIVKIDEPFMGSARTLAGSSKNKYPHLWTLQIEINCGITNEPEQSEKCVRLFETFSKWIAEIK